MAFVWRHAMPPPSIRHSWCYSLPVMTFSYTVNLKLLRQRWFSVPSLSSGRAAEQAGHRQPNWRFVISALCVPHHYGCCVLGVSTRMMAGGRGGFHYRTCARARLQLPLSLRRCLPHTTTTTHTHARTHFARTRTRAARAHARAHTHYRVAHAHTLRTRLRAARAFASYRTHTVLVSAAHFTRVSRAYGVALSLLCPGLALTTPAGARATPSLPLFGTTPHLQRGEQSCFARISAGQRGDAISVSRHIPVTRAVWRVVTDGITGALALYASALQRRSASPYRVRLIHYALYALADARLGGVPL